MKYIKTGLLVVNILLAGISSVTAQSFKTIKATRQHWAGGVVGRFGINYFIELATSSHTSIPDTVWINGYVYPISSFSSNGQYSKKTDSVTHEIHYSILVSEAHDQYANKRYPNQKKDTITAKPLHLRAFEGAALISYRYKKKQRFFTVKSFTDLKQLNYP
ncbi:MAG TPA: hypothetical protein VK809_04025 [Bacteroidia bacterium]|jgi:hypothetical protein|nr:hypothetical protein [Bacteroidia bacterium]